VRRVARLENEPNLNGVLVKEADPAPGALLAKVVQLMGLDSD
jgi:hypothetical protein